MGIVYLDVRSCLWDNLVGSGKLFSITVACACQDGGCYSEWQSFDPEDVRV